MDCNEIGRALRKRGLIGEGRRLKVSQVGSLIAFRVEDPMASLTVQTWTTLLREANTLICEHFKDAQMLPCLPYHVGGCVQNWRYGR